MQYSVQQLPRTKQPWKKTEEEQQEEEEIKESRSHPPPICPFTHLPIPAATTPGLFFPSSLRQQDIPRMHLFKKSKASSVSSPPGHYPVRSSEQLGRPALAPPDHSTSSIESPYDRDIRNIYDESSPSLQPLSHHQYPSPAQTPHRAQSQRRQPHSRPTVSAVAPEDPQPRRQKKSLFVRPTSGFIERSVSVKGGRSPNPASQPTSPRAPQAYEDLDQDQTDSPASDSPVYDQQSALPHQHQQYLQSFDRRSLHQSRPSQDSDSEWSSQKFVKPLALNRSRTDITDQLLRSSPTDQLPESPRYGVDQVSRPRPRSRNDDLVLNSRPSSRQQLESQPQQMSHAHPDTMQQTPTQAPPQGTQQQTVDRASGNQELGRRGSTAPPTQPAQDQSRGTPAPNRSREEIEAVDVRALMQKHDELRKFSRFYFPLSSFLFPSPPSSPLSVLGSTTHQYELTCEHVESKYSKVKRYYFEKEAQVQHLQNTVAHQRMAVSRTVLDDNEYTNRFQRLDGAIKDLSFSVRKDWRGIPQWLHGFATDDAVSVGTKEMMALGRAVITRWLVEEVFQRHFHPGLEPGLSIQLKNIEMNLRRQQIRPVTDEDRENIIAKLSNWRRATFDGLGDILSTPAAQEHRADLIEHLTVELATFLSTQLQEQALPGLEAGVRMIIENTVNIIEKIPLEARDVCVEYFPPNIAFHDNYMKVEGQLPQLSHPPPPPTEEMEDMIVDADSSSPGSNSTGAGDAVAPPPREREARKKSVFSTLIGRRSNEPSARPAAGEKAPEPEQSRIRYASFLTVEVRGKGPATVLIKAPVWLIE